MRNLRTQDIGGRELGGISYDDQWFPVANIAFKVRLTTTGLNGRMETWQFQNAGLATVRTRRRLAHFVARHAKWQFIGCKSAMSFEKFRLRKACRKALKLFATFFATQFIWFYLQSNLKVGSL